MAEIQHYEADITAKNRTLISADIVDLEKGLGVEVEIEGMSHYEGDREVQDGPRYLVGIVVGGPEWVELQRTGYLVLDRGDVKVTIEL